MLPGFKIRCCRTTVINKGIDYTFPPATSPSIWGVGGHYIIHYNIYKALYMYTNHTDVVLLDQANSNLSAKHFISLRIASYCSLFFFMGSPCHFWNGANILSDGCVYFVISSYGTSHLASATDCHCHADVMFHVVHIQDNTALYTVQWCMDVLLKASHNTDNAL